MSVAKVIELVGSSTESWEEAVRAAVSEASRTLRGVHGVDVRDWTASVEDGEIVAYKATVKIAFAVEVEGEEEDEDSEDADADEEEEEAEAPAPVTRGGGRRR
ncbi:MAG TPA: dodecin family protein [Thermoanaerobaculia bacterium]|nr:dodecin family protein [Thermoanaerobaculia bacterium]